MVNRSIVDEIITIVQSEANNNPAPVNCTVVGNYTDNGFVDIELDGGDVLRYVKVVGSNLIGSNGVLCFIDGDEANKIVLTDNTRENELNTILALGLGLFNIVDGDLLVELPLALENIFEINNNGELLVELPSGVENNYEIIDNDLFYERMEMI